MPTKDTEEPEDDEYAPLYTELEKIELPRNENVDEKKCRELLGRQKPVLYDGPESDGLRLAVASENSRVRKEAQKYCDHEFGVSYDETYTADARLKLQRDAVCEKCGLRQTDIATEEVSEEAIWR